jgi:tRNA(Ile)-lysidine synthase
MPYVLARRVARLALVRASDGRYMGLLHAERVVDLVLGRVRGSLALPGLQADLVGDELLLRRRAGRDALAVEEVVGAAFGTSYRSALSTPGEAPLGDGRVVSSNLRHTRPSAVEVAELSGPDSAVVDAALCTELAVRFRRPGDRFRPLGLRGRKTLQDFFVDRKVPRRERGRVPLVVDGEDRIVWVAGYAVSGDFRVSEATRAVVILKLRGERA